MNFLRKRILTYLIVLAVVVNLDFILPRIAPGNAAQILVSDYSNPGLQSKLLEQRFGLDQPVIVQYYLYLKNIFATWPPNFGISFQFFPAQVNGLIAQRIGWTILLILASLAFSIFIAYVLAGISSLRRGGKAELSSTYGSILLNATPVYWTGLILIWLFAVDLHWFPIFGAFDLGTKSTLSYVASVLWHGVLPVIALSTSVVGEIYLILRGTTQEVMKSDYVIAASLRGLRPRILAQKYILRNSLLPVVALLSFSLAGLISRAVLVEAVFGYAGLGDLLVDGIFNRDYPVLQGTLFVLTVIIIIGGIVGDLVLVRLDPRLRK
ncbi:MAG: ABC transporter permease [Thaumarchaeota archaeon]|nr:ABC transporter permease [Nitrososphaerota archaeon]